MSEAYPNSDADFLERRRRWREWISMDLPAGERATRRPTVRRASPIREDDWLPDVINASPATLRGLATAIRESLTGDQLTAEDRTRLIARSEHLGLSRFEANLLIAAVLHRETRVKRPAKPLPIDKPTRPWSVTTLLLAMLGIELVAIVAGWLLLR